MTTPNGPRVACVTPAQRRVLLELMRDGADNETIARRLGLYRGTVANHMTAALTAAAVATRTGLVLALERRQVVLRLVDRRTESRTE